MNYKTTFAVAAFSLAFGVNAYAQNNVTLYGVLDAGVGYTKTTVENQSASKFGGVYGVQVPNLVGLRGTEDLGDGTKVNFVLETGFDLGNGSDVMNSLFGRQATVGVSNNKWGSVDIGRKRTVGSDYFAPIDPFSVSYSQASAGVAFGSINNTRYSNMIQYRTPSFSGFNVGVGYSFNTGMTGVYDNFVVTGDQGFATNNNMRAVTVGGNYTNGPVYAAVTYDAVIADDRFKTDATGGSVSSWNLGGTYDFKVVKVGVGYGQTRNGFINGQTPLNAEGVNTSWSNGGVLFRNGYGSNSYLVGATVPVTSRTNVMASWTLLQPQGKWADSQFSRNQNTYNLGARYEVSKRTSLYGVVSYADNYGTLEGQSTMFATGMTFAF